MTLRLISIILILLPNIALGAVKFNGTSQYLDLFNNITFANVPAVWQGIGATGSNYTVSAWFKAPSTAGTAASSFGWAQDDTIIELRATSTGGGCPFSIGLTSSNFTFARANTANCGGTAGERLSSTVAMNNNQWHLGTAVVSGNNVSLYLNGRLNNSGTFSGAGANATSLTTNNANMQIGVRSTNAGAKNANFFQGSISDVRVYNRALSAADVYRLYYGSQYTYLNRPQSSSSSAAGLILWIPLTGTGNVEIGRSGSRINGIPVAFGVNRADNSNPAFMRF